MKSSRLHALVFSALALSACGLETAPNGGSGGVGGTGGLVGNTGGSTSSGGSAGLDQSCSVSSDCSLVSASCCGSCGAPTVTDMIGIRVGTEEAYRNGVCAGSTGCPLCAAQENPNLFAVCDSGTCKAIDVGAEEASSCTSDLDCKVVPRACCSCGAGAPFVAVNVNSNFVAETLCTPGQACAECEFLPPSDLSALCAGGHCSIAVLLK